MRNPDFTPSKATFSASRLKGQDIAGSLDNFGCALIAGLFAPKALREFDERIERNSIGVDEALRSVGAPPNFNIGFPLYFGGTDSKESVHGCLQRSYPQIFDPVFMRDMDCWSVTNYVFSTLNKTGLGEIIRNYLGLKRLCTSAALCHIRKFDFPNGNIREAEKGLEFHQDNKLYDTNKEILTLWFPFRYEHGAMASLEFLPTREKKLFPTVTQCGIDRDSVPQDMFWSPEYQLGDAVLISGYSPHRTYYPKTGHKARTSIDFRFFSTQEIPAPIYAPKRFWFSLPHRLL